MPQLLDTRLIGLDIGDVATRSYTGATAGWVLQVGGDGQSMVLGPVPGGIAGPTGSTGPGGGSQGATGATGAPGSSGGLLNVQVFNSSGTYTPTPGTTKILVNIKAGGGGGQAYSGPAP